MRLRFSFDSSALIGAWYRRLPRDVVPSFWERLESEIARGNVGCIDEVQREIQKKDDELLAWMKTQSNLVIPMTLEIIEKARLITNRFPLTRPAKNRSTADPFVIALAQAGGATVVTEEQRTNDGNKPKIPDVCAALGVSCCDVYGFVRAYGWRF